MMSAGERKYRLSAKGKTTIAAAARRHRQSGRSKDKEALRQKKYRSSTKGKDTRAKLEKAKYRTPEGKARVRANNARRSIEVYGITVAQYKALLQSQNGGCAICASSVSRGVGKRLHIDHQHSTGTVRGLLCSPCNLAIGLFQDSPILLARASKYVEVP